MTFLKLMQTSLCVVSPMIVMTSMLPASEPIVSSDVVFQEADGQLCIEAEHYYNQEKTDKRTWYIQSTRQVVDVKPDSDPDHLVDASGGAYLEILPDTRSKHGDKMEKGVCFTDEAGLMAVLSYKAHFTSAGKYYVWVRAHSTGPEDNGCHVGLDGEWPESGKRLQWCQGKKQWYWESKQRTAEEHCGVAHEIFLDVKEPGEHIIHVSMREDGFEFDQILLTTNREMARPEGSVTPSKVRAGQLPEAFEVKELPTADMTKFPAHWGEPPQIQTRDYRALPGGYGFGSSTLAAWIEGKMEADELAKADDTCFYRPVDFDLTNTGYYSDKGGKWAAINPAKNKTASVSTNFQHASGSYDITLCTVGEEDGESTYEIKVNDKQVGTFTCPISNVSMEEGEAYNKTFPAVTINQGDVIEISSAIASVDGKEFSRARWSRILIKPADEATKAKFKK